MTRRRPPRRWRGLIILAEGTQFFSKIRMTSSRPMIRRGTMPTPVDLGDDVIHHAIWRGTKVVEHRGQN